MFVTGAVAMALGLSAVSATGDAEARLGKRIPDFQLRDQLGTSHTLTEFRGNKAIVVAFLGVECPLAKLYGKRLGEMEREYRDKGVTFVGVNSNQQDSVTEIQHYVRKHEIDFPILKDPTNTVADLFAAIRTPEMFVLDANGIVRYWGRVDDQYEVGVARPKATEHDLRHAIEDILADRPVAKATTSAPGCRIGRIRTPDPNGKITYSKHIAPIFRQRCESCHRDGEIAPFTLRSYDEVVGWAETIGEVVRDQRMPPWHADPHYGVFKNESRLTDDEKQLIYDWVNAGAPEGDPGDLPEPAVFTEGWQIPTPDFVATIPHKIHVPATGVMGYKHIAVDPGFTEDKWVVAAEARADQRAVVHHIIVFVKPPGDHEDQNLTAIEQAGARFLVATAPGARPLFCPEGTAKLIPAGSKLVFQIHYTPNGAECEDQSSVGLVFTDAANVKKRIKTAFSGTFVFEIPPHADDFLILARRPILYDTLLLSFMPHMHLRGKAFRYTALYPDGTQEILLDVPGYDFNWQNTYELAEPKLLPSGTVLEARAIYNNSANNPANPNPDRRVRFGEQTWEEMMIGFYEACPADEDLTRGGSPNLTRAEAFLDGLGGDGDPVGENLRGLARKALLTNADFRRFAIAARMLAPQVDRICIETFDKDNMRVHYAENGSGVNSRYLAVGVPQSCAGFDLTKYSKEDKPSVNDDLSKTKGFDLRLMQREFRSSLHIPFEWNGKRALISFWSKDPKAFPNLAVDVLKLVSEEISGTSTFVPLSQSDAAAR